MQPIAPIVADCNCAAAKSESDIETGTDTWQRGSHPLHHIRQPEKAFISSRRHHRHVQQLHRTTIPPGLANNVPTSHHPSNYILA